ncbi:hypothetical protein CI109_107393 [Kwoniella shandongensis]|uniref:Uncharacterized protein n=1 Tax=Kwoniella shandongensis TaxID=1734106 RepID=A0A5M6BW39_9TREE|nr:uncharacterized protein CI109_004679 [Kwoniella shandongensis]KAA5526903.1 hypothetical protein CI109_004679 [Kwoniella shandongensis]
MFIYNVHAPQRTFALSHKDGESRTDLFKRIWAKAGLNSEQQDGTGLVYEYEGDRWSLDDDDDVQILLSRFPPSSTPSATLHLTLPQAHAHFAKNSSSVPPPAYSTPASKTKAKSQKSSPSVRSTSTKTSANTKSNGQTSSKLSEIVPGAGSKDLGSPVVGGGGPVGLNGSANVQANTSGNGETTTKIGGNGNGNGNGLGAPSLKGKAKSVMSSKSRKSKWGDDDAEPLGDVRKREWEEFHNNNGVRTVVGKVGKVENVRMLLKSGYRHVYVSRDFAVKNKLVAKNFGMGSFGYTGLKAIGNIPITVGSRTETHPAYMSEENHFDVILGRAWLEKMAIKIDPLDQTALTYMDSGEPIACDLVVLKDAKGNVITIT